MKIISNQITKKKKIIHIKNKIVLLNLKKPKIRKQKYKIQIDTNLLLEIQIGMLSHLIVEKTKKINISENWIL